jgi:peptide/nickel transport system permease protein
MQRYLLTRLALMVPTLLGVAVATFLLMRVAPGDIAVLHLGGEGGIVTQADIQAERAKLGLDQPLWFQFVTWAGGLLRGDLGRSMWTDRPVSTEVSLRFGLSLELAILALVVSLCVALPLGTLSAIGRNTPLDYAVRVFSVGGLAMPGFWLGILLILFLLILFRWSPPVTFTPLLVDPLANLSQLVWPALAVGYRSAAVLARMMRSALLEVLHEDYVRTARAKGLREQIVVTRHAARNAVLPVVTLAGLEFATLLGGLVVTEQVFNLNGLGKLLVDAISHRDYTMTQALVMLTAVLFLVTNLVVDVGYAWLDPRVRLAR